ncbi:MAG: outer membrane protein assembly factor BamB family protein, partial [Planctomycetota bacterium]
MAARKVARFVPKRLAPALALVLGIGIGCEKTSPVSEPARPAAREEAGPAEDRPGAPEKEAPPRPSPAKLARRIIETTGIKGGLVVHVGCADGTLTAALRANDSYLVHGIDADAGNVERAREHIRRLGLYGNVSAERWTGDRLPYADNLVNLLVAERPGGIPADEMMRVLCPGGVAYIKKAGTWTKSVKPRPADIDEWTHFLHGPGNNAVAKDTVVAPPRHLQWISGPLWLRSHEIPSGFQAQVVGGGRVFYILDEGPIGITDQRIPERWSIYCRDAFNGRLLWQKDLPEWGWPMWAKDRAGKDWTKLRAFRTVVPPSNQRRMVTDGDRLHVTLGFNAPVSILDAATGSPVATVQGTENTDELLLSDGILLAKRKGQAGGHELVAAKAEGGDVLWRKAVGAIRNLQLAIDDGRVFCIPGRPLEARELRTGKKLWQVNAAVQGSQNMVATEGVVVLLGRRDLASHDAKTGKVLWKRNIHSRGGGEGPDLFVVGGLAWPGIMSTDGKFKPARKGAGAVVVGYDL